MPKVTRMLQLLLLLLLTLLVNVYLLVWESVTKKKIFPGY
jgi:hypothetical protein